MRTPSDEGVATAERRHFSSTDLFQLNIANSPSDLYRRVVDIAAELFAADSCTIVVADGTDLVTEASTRPESDGTDTLPIATSLPGQVLTTGKAFLVDDVQDVRSVAAAPGPQSAGPEPGLGPRSLICVPVGDEAVLVVASNEPAAFSDTDLAAGKQLASYASSVLERMDEIAGRASQNVDARLEEIATILSHDLKSPLNVATGRFKLAQETGSAEEFETGFRALARVEELLDTAIKLARTGETISEQTVVELEAVCRRSWSVLDTTDATLVVEDSHRLAADKNGLCQLLENLFRNATDHVGPDVTVRVGTLESGFYVEDDGPGIPPDRRQAVFELGHSTDDSHSGYGLTIVRRLAEAHDWSISISEGTDGGARFEITDVTVESD